MEDWLLYFILAGVTGLIFVCTTLFFRKPTDAKGEGPAAAQPQRPAAVRGPGNRRVAAVRNRRAPARQADDSDSDGGGAGDPAGDGHHAAGASGVQDDSILNDPKLGAKKRAKLEAKLEKKANREAEERIREEQKVRDAKTEEERKKREEQESKEEAERKAEERRIIEETQQKELEAYLAMKAEFGVEEEGYSREDYDADREEDLIGNFVAYIKETKLILFEEMATKFNLKVQEAIDRTNTLVSNGRITGVMDDRGKFIYISPEDLEKFAKFIKQRGRVSIAELVEYSAEIINIEERPAVAVDVV